MERAVNIIVRLIERKMAEDHWEAYTPDSYASYLGNLTDEEIEEAINDKP